MEKNRKRAERRHHFARIKRKRLDYYGGQALDMPRVDRLRVAGIYARTMPVCSCWMCGNPRRYLGEVTMQERRFAELAREEELSV
ncbi:MAG: hypothetical protein V4724_01980 [Pseudomonadota bacterium]